MTCVMGDVVFCKFIDAAYSPSTIYYARVAELLPVARWLPFSYGTICSETSIVYTYISMTVSVTCFGMACAPCDITSCGSPVSLERLQPRAAATAAAIGQGEEWQQQR